MIPYVLTANEDEETLARGVADVGSLQVAHVYAEALLNAAEQAGQVEDVFAAFEAMQATLEAPRSELRRFFSSGVVSRDTRADIIRKAFDGRAQPLLVNFLLVLNQHERTALLPTMFFQLQQLRDERMNRLPVTVHAAVPLTDEQLEAIRRTVWESLKLEPMIEVKTDPELLGGILLRVGDWVFDGTVRTRLNEMRNQIIARSSHEIQSGRDRFSSPV